jgi:GNAT superfamily N-acetyltransferase
MRDLAIINGRAYGMPLEMFECMSNMHLWHDDSFGFVGYADGQPVSCAAVFPVDGTVYVALVATNPDAHGKGFAESVMRHAIEAGVKGMGFSRVTLHATEMGRPLYTSMGFAEGPKLGILMAAAEAASGH